MSWHVYCDSCLKDICGPHMVRLRHMPESYRNFIYLFQPAERRRGIAIPDKKPMCYGTSFVGTKKDCNACPFDKRCVDECRAAHTQKHPDECSCEKCLAARKPLIDQIIDLSNDIKRKERETGKVPNTIPPKSQGFPIVKNKLPSLNTDDIVSAQPMTAHSENIFMEKNADGTQTMCFKPSQPYEWRYVLRPVRKLERRRSSGWDPCGTGADRRDGWDS